MPARKLPLAAALWIGTLLCGSGACSSGGSAGGSGSDAGGPADSGGQADTGSIFAACNDGTGALDCCSPGVAGGASCASEGAQCWTPCNQGIHGHMACSGGVWTAGHGLFPCGDGGGTSDDAAVDASDASDAGDGAPADASDGGDAGNACTASGGSVGVSSCCTSIGDFPSNCVVGACGCSPSNSHMVQVCNCPGGKCFDGTTCR